MPLYESVIIARQDLSAPQAEALRDELIAILTAQGGEILRVEYWGLRNIAYRIKKNRKGHYFLLNVNAPSAALKEMERQMSINEDVLRFLNIQVEEVEEGPSVMLQARAQRDERPRRNGERDRGERDRKPMEGDEA